MKYVVNWPLEYNGKSYKKDDTISLDEKVGAPLVELGNLTPAGKSDKGQAPAPVQDSTVPPAEDPPPPPAE